MTLALRLRKWGGGGGKLLLAFIHPVHRLEAGVPVSAPRQGAEEDRELWPPPGRWEGPSVPPLPPSTLFPPIPFSFTGTALRGKGAATSWLLWQKGRSWRPLGEGAKLGFPAQQQPGSAAPHAAHVGPISHAGLAPRRSRWG